MADHFHLNIDPAELTNAETKLQWLQDQLGSGGEGGKLAQLKGNSGSWTGEAATACLGEMGTIASTMTGAAPKFGDAKGAVTTFKSALQTAKDDTLPKLNTQWDESVSTYQTAVSKATSTYSNETAPYRHMPDEDTEQPLAEAKTKRDKAIADATSTQTTTQNSINVDYEAMITSLKTAAKTCGDALASAVVISFTSEQWTAVKGGHIPIGLKAQLRQQVMGADSILRHSDGLVVGEYVASKLDDEAKNKNSQDKLDPEILALMQQFGKDPAFVEGMLTKLGPAGTAYLAYRTNELINWSTEDGAKQQGKELMSALSTILSTGSYITVTTANGSSKPLMDKEWLDHFDPKGYAALSDVNKASFEGYNWVDGYQPGLLLPFLNSKNAVSPSFSTVVAQRALDDYEAAHKDGELLWDSDAGRRWALYGGFGMNADWNTRTGKTDDPFAYDVFHIAMERAADYGSSSNTIMLTHRDTMLMLMTGGDPLLVGGRDAYGDRHDWLSSTLGQILKQSTIGYQGSDVISADGALWGVADYLQKHPDAHFLHNVNLALGDVITDPRMFSGAMSSVTGPNFAGTGYLDDPNHPNAGPLMSPEMWARLHQEGMLVPETTATLIKEYGQYINGTSNDAQHYGYTWDPEKQELVQNNTVTSLSLYQAEAARHFLGQNLLADHDELVKAMEEELKQNGENKERAKAIVGQLVDWAKDPTSIKDDVIGKLTDFAVDKTVDWFFPSDDEIKQKYDASIKSLSDDLANPIVKPGFWDDVNGTASQLVKDTSSGAGPTSTDSVIPNYTNPSDHKVYTGDPTQYVGKESQYVGGGTVITDDFLTYDKTTGKPDGIVPPSEMNNLQRQAYLNWLHDPAVQSYLDDKLSAVEEARKRAGG